MDLIRKTMDFDNFWGRYKTDKRGSRFTKEEREVFENLCRLPNADAAIFIAFAPKIDWYQLGEAYPYWTETLIDDVKDNTFFITDHAFNGLCANKNFNWTERLVKKYQNDIYWRGLAGNESFKPSLAFLKTYKSSWDWEYWFQYSQPDHIVWDSDNLKELHSEVIPYIKQSQYVNWNIELINDYADLLFPDICENKYIDWSDEIIQKFVNRIDWDIISENESFPFNLPLIKQVGDKLDFNLISGNKRINWSKEIIETGYDKWNWDALCGNSAIGWDSQLIIHFKEKVKWDHISTLSKKWEFDFLCMFEKYLNWAILSKNKSIIWTSKMIDRFQDKIDFWSLSLYGNLSFDIIETFRERWDITGCLTTKWVSFSDFGSESYDEITSGWDNLSFNQNIIWTDESLRYFFDKINWYYLAEKGCFRLSEEMIQKLPETGKKFSPSHSVHNERSDYKTVSVKDQILNRNICF